MVKISIKKDKKTKTKPKQKQKQKQSQKVIVNIGSNATRAKRRSTLERNKAINRSTPTPAPNIIIPQAMPQSSNNEILRYIRESEQQKEMIKKQEKSNELEKDKIKKASVIPTEEKAQVQFSKVDSRNISSLTSGTASPNPLSFPANHDDLYDTLMRVADLRGENPNSGRVSFSTLQSNPLSSNQFIGSSNTSIMTDQGYIDDDYDSIASYATKTPLEHSHLPYSLGEYLATKPDDIEEPETEENAIINQQELVETKQEPPLEIITNEPSEVDAVIIETPEPEKTAYEQADEALTLIDEALKPNIKQTESGPAEEPPQMIEIKRVDDEPGTPQQRRNFHEVQVGDLTTAEKLEQRSKQIQDKWRELRDGGPLKDFQLYKNGRLRASNSLLDEINMVEPSWEPIPTNRVGGRKKKMQ